MGGVSLLGVGAKEVRSGKRLRLKGPGAGVGDWGFLERSSQPIPRQLEG